MRLINAEALKTRINFSVTITGKDNAVEVKRLMELYNKAIDNAPTIEAEPVVRCKECWKLNRLKKYTGFGEVQFVCENTKMTVYETDFCSYGERREP